MIHGDLMIFNDINFSSGFMKKPLGSAPALILMSLMAVSCSDTPQQYTSKGESENPERTLYDIPSPLTQPSNKGGGLSLYQKTELSPKEKDARIRKNSLAPIGYQTGSVGNISIKTKYKESLDILNLSYAGNAHYYDEGIIVLWRDDPPRVPYLIFITGAYQGSIDFGPFMGNQRHVKIGQSFADKFSLGVKDIEKDEKAISFIVSLYKWLEGTDENCLESKKCQLSINPQGNYIVFSLPKMTFLFGNDQRKNLAQIAISNEHKSGCFGKPFDLLKTQFLCGSPSQESSEPAVRLGDSYKEAVDKSGIRSNLPISYGNTAYFQNTEAANLGWRRIHYEEKLKAIPEDSPLVYVSMGRDYNSPFMIDNSLIKIQIKSDSSVQISKEPLRPEKDREADIQAKMKLIKDSPDALFLSSSMPQIKGNYRLQKNLLKALLDLMEESYTSFYSASEGQLKIHKRIYGEYNDKHALSAGASLLISFNNSPPLTLRLRIDEPSGSLTLSVSLIKEDFYQYAIKNQAPIDLSSKKTKIAGFALGDKIYLRNKDIGKGAAIVSYLAGDDQEREILTALADYSYEEEISAVYESGRDRNISYQKGEGISVGGVSLIINPTFKSREIQDKLYDEYEINSLAVNGSSFFEAINSLCFIEGFQLKMGMYDRLFAQTLIQKIKQAGSHALSSKESARKKNFPGCYYISPNDSLFSGLKRVYHFPDHRLALAFANRELYALRIYKKPTEYKKEEAPHQ